MTPEKGKTKSSVAKEADEETLWSVDSPACVTLWGALLGLREVPDDAAFSEWGSLQVTALENYVGAASSDMIRARSARLAFALDNQFRVLWGARLETDVNLEQAIEGLMGVLGDGDKMLSHLAAAANKYYRFWREVDS